MDAFREIYIAACRAAIVISYTPFEIIHLFLGRNTWNTLAFAHHQRYEPALDRGRQAYTADVTSRFTMAI
jgi:hypothetical protein